MSEDIEAALNEVPRTLCIIGTNNGDGTVTMQYHGAVLPNALALIRALAGPVLVEQILSAEDMAFHAAGPNGLIMPVGP